MIVYDDVVQGTSEWAALRVGVVTASRLEDILTPAKLEFSKSADKYAFELIAEEHLGSPLDNALASTSITRGQVLERSAMSYYLLQRDDLDESDLKSVGFVMRDGQRVGCSPDKFVGTNGLAEVKCPEPHTHISYLLDQAGIGYRLQVQGQLWICEREWNDTISYHPDMPAALVRQYRDEKVITAIEIAVNRFLERRDELKVQLQKFGMFPDFNRASLSAHTERRSA